MWLGNDLEISGSVGGLLQGLFSDILLETLTSVLKNFSQEMLMSDSELLTHRADL